MNGGLIAVAVALLAAGQSHPIERKTHDHTIYTVQGSADQLAKFQKDIGSRWGGGILLDTDEEGGQYRYWAYSERTAPQAREFMFGSMVSGLELDMEAYEEQEFFPAERSELDAIATRCGFESDPFFITPTRELRVGPVPDAPFEAIDCAMGELKASELLRELPSGFVGNTALPEKAE